MQKYFSKLKRGLAAFLAVMTMVTCAPLEFITVASAATQDFEMEVKGATGFAPRDLAVTLTDGSSWTMKAGTAFTIVEESGANWKFKTSAANGSKEGTVASKDCMINFPDVMPSVEFDILNAQSAKYSVHGKTLPGVTGQNLYGNIKLQNPRLGKAEYLCPIMYPTAKKWAQVQNALKAAYGDGEGLIVYDMYRPFAVQQKVKTAVDQVSTTAGYKELLWANYPSTAGVWHPGWFISSGVSNHQRGTAADVGLKSARNTATDMPSEIHDLSMSGVVYTTPTGSTLTEGMKNSAGAQRLKSVCNNAGLKTLASEWWHFDDDATQSTVKDINKGNFYVTECLSVAPDKVATDAGTGSTATDPGGTGTGGGTTGTGPDGSGSGGEGPAGPPAKATLSSFPTKGGTFTYLPAFDNNNSIVFTPGKTAKQHYITMDIELSSGKGGERMVFCDNHAGSLSTNCIGKEWGTTVEVTDPVMKLVLTIGYGNLYCNNGKKDDGPGTALSISEETAKWSVAATQAYVWAVKANPSWYTALLDYDGATEPHLGDGQTCPADYNEAAKARYRLAKERVTASIGKVEKGHIYETVSGTSYDCSTPEGLAQAILDSENSLHGSMARYLSGEWPEYECYEMLDSKCPLSHKAKHQGMFVAYPPDEGGGSPNYGYAVKIRKVDENGNPLSGVKFALYENGSEVRTATSAGDGYATFVVNCGKTQHGSGHDVEIKELESAQGYVGETGIVWSGHADCTNGGNNAARAVTADKEVVNHTTDKDAPLRKIDSHTGKGVGPARFHFEGTTQEGKPWRDDILTDENGLYVYQWTRPENPNYIPPGTYTVTETQAPPGYTLSGEVKTLTLWYDEEDTNAVPTSSGDLIFQNDKMIKLKLYKVSADNEPLAGAQFEIYKDGALWDSGQTDEEGYVYFEGRDGDGLEEGMYKIVEINPPKGYLLPYKNWVEIHIDPADITQGEDVEVRMVNYWYPEIEIIKMSKDTGTDTFLDGATFKITIDGEEFISSKETANGGKILITQEEFGDFLKQHPDLALKESWTVRVEELTAPDGYIVDDPNWQEATIHQGQKLLPFTFRDTKYPKIRIRKTDINDPTLLLDGAVFEVFIDDQSIGTFTTGEDGPTGFIEIEYEKYGRFLKDEATGDRNFNVKVIERVAPKGYIINNPNWQTKPLNVGQTQLDFEFTDTKYKEIWVRKLDAETGERLPDMEFSVQINGVNIGTFRTRDEDVEKNDGWYKITYDMLKEFLGTHGGDIMDDNGWQVTVTEDSPPQFYNYDVQRGDGANGHSITKTLQPGQDKLMFEFENTHYRSIKVHKVDQEKGWDLKNAEFTLTCIELDDAQLNFANGWGTGVSKQGKTNAEGWYVFENLPNGWYELTESKAPPGYLGNDTTGVTEENKGHWTDTGKSGPRRIHVTSASGADGSEEAPNAKNRFLEFTYENTTPVGVHIFKRDGLTGEPIKGVKFVIKSLPPLDPYEETFETDENGLIVIEDQAYGGLKPGSYEVTETYVPKPYNLPKDGSNTQILKIEARHQTYNLTFNNYPDMYVYAVKRDSKTGLPVPGAKFELTEVGGGRVGDIVTSGENGFAMLGPVEPGKSYTITEIAPPDGYELTIPNHQNFKVPDVTSNWSAEFEFSDNPLCNLWLRKVDATNSNKGLQGAEFRIEKAGGGIVKQNAVTDNEGYINVKGLEPGDYVAIEITPPPGYMLPEGKDAETRIHLESGKTETILIRNYKPGGLQIRKVDAKTGEALTGAEFQLYDAYEKPIGSAVKVGSDGFARWADLEPGVYFVEETKAPEGYAKTEGKKRFEIVGFESVTYEWPNAEEATITIYKRDGETLLPLSGAEFEVRDLNGAVVDKLVTNRNGTATSKKLPLGFYQVVETKAPAGYQIVETKSDPIEVKAGTPVVLERENWSDKTIIIRKRDVNTQEPLQGAWFELQTIDGEILQDAICTDASGVAVTKQVEPGQYYLVETKAPDGYKIIQEKILVEVKSGKGISVDVDNMPTTIVQVYKTDKVSGDPIPNTEFALKDKDGDVLEVLMTDISGWAYSSPLPAGHYCIVETQAAPGYIKDTEEHWFDLKEGQNYTLMLKNQPGEHIIVTKVDATESTGQGAASRKPLAGAVFELQTDVTTGDCMVLGTYTTDEYGKFEVEGVAPGFYRLYEKAAPDGYATPEGEDAYTRICVKSGELNQFVIENIKLGTLVVKKVDTKDNKPVAGAKMRLSTVGGDYIGDLETDANGEAIWYNLKAGFYVVTEVVAPDNYDPAQCPSQNVEVKNGQTSTVTFKDNAYASLVIILQDKQTGEYLEGGQFVVTRLSDMTIVFDSKTDITGTLVVGNLQPGWYEVVEKFSPDGYTIIESTQKVEIKAGIQQTIYFYNTTSGLVIEKVDSQDTSKTLEGARFKVTRVEDDTVIGEYVTDKSGVALVSGLKPGYYKVEEVAAPLGYEIDDPTPKQVDMHGGLTGHVTFMDTARASITINVVDKDTQKGLAGCTVEVWRQNGEKVDEWTSDKTGMIETEKMAPGHYVLKLVKVLDGYKAVISETTVELKAGIETTYKFECTSSGSATVVGKDEQGNLLANVKFRVTLLDGTFVGEYVTGADGTYDLSGLAPGNYVITWMSGPSGYEVITNVQNVTITANGSTQITIVHKLLSDITIECRDKDTKQPLNAVTVEIWKEHGDMVQSIVTDATGKITTDKLDNGNYVIKLITWPDGYTPVVTEKTITVTYSRTITVQFEFESSGSLTVNGYDHENKLMAGVKFTVTDMSGAVVGTYVTDATGKFVISGLKPGNYVVTETECPSGFNMIEASIKQTVEIKANGSVTVDFKHIKDSEVNVDVVDKDTRAPLNGVTIEIWQQNGSLVNTFMTDSTGKIYVGTLPNGFYVLKLVKCIDGYTPVTTETVIEVKTGVSVNFTFECISNGVLRVQSTDNAQANIPGMMFTVTDLNGTPVGSYATGTDGVYTFSSLNPGWYVITETKAPDGYVIDESVKEQKVEVKAGQAVTVTFAHSKIFGLQIRTTVQQTGAVISGATYKITTLEGIEVKTITSNDAGIAFEALQPGWYVVTPLTAPNGYTFVDTTPRNVEVKADGLTTVDFLVSQGSSIRIKVIDGTTSAPLYNVRIQLKNSAGVCIKEYYTNDQGVIVLDQVVTAGGYTVEMISAPAGYIVDAMPHSLDVQNGATTEIVYKLYKEGGQIQVVVTSSAYNKTLDLSAGTPLQGAVFEITNPDTYQTVGTMISNAQGIAASSALPIGRYTVKMVTAPAYYGINTTFNPEVRIKINNDVVRTETTVGPVNLGAKITQATNTTAKAGSTIRVDMTAANNTSDTRVDSFFVHVKVPTDAARIVSFNPGTWTHEVWYSISYKTTANDYRKLASNLNSGNNYTYDLSTKSLGLMAGEYVTDIRLEFGTVPAGFAVKTKSTYGLYIQGVPNGYKMLVRAEAGGLAQATTVGTNHVTIPDGFADTLGGGQAVMNGASSSWVTGTSICTVNISNAGGKLPKTGY